MPTLVLSVPNISCDHCIMAIKRELGELSGVSQVEGDVEKKEVTVSYDTEETLAAIRSTLEEIGYPVAE
ncbi:MAG: heavy-metal-associated domain-containing protein [Anaerolineae bacterium]